MKKFIIWLVLSTISLAAFAQKQEQPFRLKVVSNEINTINSHLKIELCIYADAEVKLNHEVHLQATEGLQLKDHAPDKAYGKIKEYLEAGDSTTISLILNYNKKKLPHNHQDIRLILKSLKPDFASAETWAFIYFTPYKTVETWGQDDFTELKRSWNTTPASKLPTEQVFINRKNIPASDLSDADHTDPNVAKSYITIAGLDYAIPMHFIEDEGSLENLPVRDKQNATKTASYFSLEQ